MEVSNVVEERDMERYTIGVDIGGTTVKLGLFKARGELIEKWEIATRTENHSEQLLPDIAEAVQGKLAERGLSVGSVIGIGMGVPGAVLDDGYVKPCVNLDQWGGFDAGRRLTELIGVPVKVVNDANAAALGEMACGSGKGRRNMVFVTLGTGVGGGVIIDGKLLAGVHGAAGEIGHMKVKADEAQPCGCGRYGCLEQYASATGLVRSAKAAIAAGGAETALCGYERLTCKDIFDCAKAGDKVALELIDEMTKALGRALAGVSCVCDPEVIVIGGGVARAGEILLEGVRKHFRESAFPVSENTDFALAELGSEAGIYGGAQLALRA